MTEDSRLICSLDVYEESRALEIARIAEGRVRAIKVNWPLVMTEGIGVVSKLSKYADILCDLKVADIPNTNRLITEKVRDSGGWGIITHIFPGLDSFDAVVKAAGDMNVLGVVAMSHPGSKDFMLEHREAFLEAAKKSEIYGIIASGTDYRTTRELKSRAGNLKIVTPGVGAQGGRASEAIRSGADFVIVGRAIYESNDPSGVIDSINHQVKEVVELK